jgi:hypothetical protein
MRTAQQFEPYPEVGMEPVPVAAPRRPRRMPAWYLAAKTGPLGAPIAFTLIGVGLVVLVVTWYQASGTVFLPEQIAYLASGGTLGLALVALGIGMLITSTARDDSANVQATLERILVAVERVAAALEPAGGEPRLIWRAGDAAHVPGCLAVEDGEAELVVLDVAARSELEPCPLCQPWPAAARA